MNVPKKQQPGILVAHSTLVFLESLTLKYCFPLTVNIICSATSVKYVITMPDTFSGGIRLDTDPTTPNADCDFTSSPSGTTSYTEYEVTFSLDATTDAGECDLANLDESTSVSIDAPCIYIRQKNPNLFRNSSLAFLQN